MAMTVERTVLSLYFYQNDIYSPSVLLFVHLACARSAHALHDLSKRPKGVNKRDTITPMTIPVIS